MTMNDTIIVEELEMFNSFFQFSFRKKEKGIKRGSLSQKRKKGGVNRQDTNYGLNQTGRIFISVFFKE